MLGYNFCKKHELENDLNTQLQDKFKTKLYASFQNWNDSKFPFKFKSLVSIRPLLFVSFFFSGSFHHFHPPNPQRDSELLGGVSPADIAAAAEKAEAATKVNTAAGGNLEGEETGMRDIL